MAQSKQPQTSKRSRRASQHSWRQAGGGGDGEEENSRERWSEGYGVIRHSRETKARAAEMAATLASKGVQGDGIPLFQLLRAADLLASAAMWLVVHETYASRVYLDGRDLSQDEFKPDPQGHTGGSLNMVPAYVGYMAANAMSGITRSWIMGQGHCVSAIDSVNLLLGNVLPAHAARYSITDEGLTRYVQDFYSYNLGPDGRQDSPLGSHVNGNTAGGLAEGGYLGFTELEYVHMPVPGERLVVFLSDGAFEEQRGSDWAARWWRAKDTGLVMPIMINNGRRIDQRTTLSQEGGISWFVEHLKLNSFDPIVFDGRDPAAFVWAIYEMERRLEAASKAVGSGEERYPIPLPYGIAVAPKGAGFPGEGTNLAHNLPLMSNPHSDRGAADLFNLGARKLWVSPEELNQAIEKLQHHVVTGRPRERDHPLVHRDVNLREVPEVSMRPVSSARRNPSLWTRSSPMLAVDETFLAMVKANPALRARVGNPDEMRSNRLQKTLDHLRFRVTAPEKQVPESIHGKVITALNEEAVAAAALANKAGINLIATYEAFGPKMLGLVRQEITFTRMCNEAGRSQDWLSIPLILTSHTWENGKNEISHQDTTMCEALFGETSEIARVFFVPDYNVTAMLMQSVYQTHGQYWTIVAPKKDDIPDLFTPEEAQVLIGQGALRLAWAGYEVERQLVILTAIGAYQLEEALKASRRLVEKRVPHSVVYMLEPARFRAPRNDGEKAHAASPTLRETLYPASVRARVFVSHTRPEPVMGLLQPLNTGGSYTRAVGFLGNGGTLQVSGMLFANKCTWAHVLSQVVEVLGLPRRELLTPEELAAIDCKASPEGVVV